MPEFQKKAHEIRAYDILPNFLGLGITLHVLETGYTGRDTSIHHIVGHWNTFDKSQLDKHFSYALPADSLHTVSGQWGKNG